MISRDVFKHLQDLREYRLRICVGFAVLIDRNGDSVFTTNDTAFVDTLIGLGIDCGFNGLEATLEPRIVTHSESGEI